MGVRVATVADADAIAAIYEPAVLGSVISFEETAPDAAEMARRMAAGTAFCPWLVYEEQGIVLGYAYAGPHRKRAAYRYSCEVSVYVHPAAHRRGIGIALYEALFSRLRAMGMVNVYAGISNPADNPGSVRLHERFGFELVGVFRGIGFKNGAWHDVGWWALRWEPDHGR